MRLAAAFLLSMLRAPESPRFLIQAGDSEEGFAFSGTSHRHRTGTPSIDGIALGQTQGRINHADFTTIFPLGLQKALIIGTLVRANAALRYCIAMLPCCRVIASLRCHVVALLHRYVATIATSHCICRIAALPHHISPNTNAATQ